MSLLDDALSQPGRQIEKEPEIEVLELAIAWMSLLDDALLDMIEIRIKAGDGGK